MCEKSVFFLAKSKTEIYRGVKGQPYCIYVCYYIYIYTCAYLVLVLVFKRALLPLFDRAITGVSTTIASTKAFDIPLLYIYIYICVMLYVYVVLCCVVLCCVMLLHCIKLKQKISK